MKNFTRFLALTLAILFAVGTISVAATQFPDVDESNPYAKEIDVVSSMGIVTGAKGMFNDGKVARWQFTVYAAKALTGVTSDDVWTKNENNTTFTDLASRTAPAAVSWAVSNDLIKGRSTTEFDPYTTITLAEASAIMVRALGYDYDVRYNAEQPSAWKWAYLTKAMELGVTKGLESAALSPDHEVTKSEAALLIYNTLFITRKNGSTISDKIWGGVEVGEDAVAQQFIITAVKVGNDTDQLANTYALHSFAGVKLNGFADGKVDEDITLYLTSDEFKDLTGVDAKTVLTKGYVGASLDALYAADGQEIEELSLNAPADPYAGLIVGGEFDDTAKTLTVKGVTFDYATTDFYVTHESQKGYPALRDPAVYKMSTREQVCYGVNGEEVVDRVGNKFFLDIDDNIVAENVHDTNSVAYVGVIVSGQYGKFESSAEIDSQYVGEELNVDGNYRVATEADLAKAALVDTVYETPAKANEATFEQAKEEIAYGKYSITAFDDDGDGVADRIFITGTAYNESILRIVPAEKKVKILQQNNDGVPGWVDLVTTGNKDALSRNVRINNTEIKTFTDLNKASDNDFFIAMVPDAGTIEFVEWIPYLYGEIVNLAELVNPTVDYDVTTAVIGILDKTTNVRSDYFVDINPVLFANINNAKEAWKYRYNKVAVDVAADVDWLVGDPTSEHPTFKDRSVLVSQWVKYIALPTTVIAGAKDGKATGTKATEPKEMILYITQDKGDNIDGIYVSSLVAGETASFTFYDLKNGERKTIDNVSLYDTIFNDNSLVWVKQLKSNLAIDNGDKNFAYVANPETASVDAYKTLEQLFADDTAGTVAEHYTLADPAAFDAGNEYFTFAAAG
ncbi:MAG: S-layer homology domain-containing protein, partial [Clostridia bacterium]|nr:S-layer homology domain-containing protein [Clostridia bacterium]